MNVSDAIIRYLVEQDVDTLFTLMAEDVMGVTVPLQKEWSDEVRVLSTRHEQLAMAMADGYARSRDDIGVCIVGRGPAIAQTATALKTAHVNGSRLLVITGESPLASHEELKGFDQETFLGTVAEDVVSVRDDDVLLPKLRDAFRRLRNGSGPIVVQVPWDLMDSETDVVDEVPSQVFGTARAAETGTHEPADEKVEAVVDAYLESDASVPPVILAGEGAVKAGAKDAIERLAERTSAILTETLQANGYFSDHPYGAGFVGTFGTNLANEYLTQSDFVLAVGSSLNNHTTDMGRLVEDATVVHVDADPAAIERYTPVDIGVVGDASATVDAIADELADRGIDFSGTFWTENTKRRLAETSPWEGQEFTDVAGRMDPREFVLELDGLLPADRQVVTDAGHFLNFVLDGISVPHPEDYMWTLDFGAIGLGLPMGIGAAARTDDRTTVTFVGDAGLMMSLQALETAVVEEVPGLIVVMNDGALGSEYQQLENRGLPMDVAVSETPDLAALARDFGAEAHTVTSIDELHGVEETLSQEPDGPVLIDCKIDRDAKHRFYESEHMM